MSWTLEAGFALGALILTLLLSGLGLVFKHRRSMPYLNANTSSLLHLLVEGAILSYIHVTNTYTIKQIRRLESGGVLHLGSNGQIWLPSDCISKQRILPWSARSNDVLCCREEAPDKNNCQNHHLEEDRKNRKDQMAYSSHRQCTPGTCVPLLRQEVFTSTGVLKTVVSSGLRVYGGMLALTWSILYLCMSTSFAAANW